MKLRYAPLLLLSFTSHAQGLMYQIDMKEQVFSLAEPRFYAAEVLDLRFNKHSIGRVQRGLNNMPVPANLKDGAAPGLTAWLQSQLPAKPGLQPVIMRIHELKIDEVTKVTSEKARAVVDVDFVVQQPNGSYYVLLRHPDEELHGGIETTGFHDDNIAACLKRGLTLLNTLSWEQRLSSAQPLTAEQLRYRNGRVPAPYTYPILTSAAPAKGVYHSFLDFRRNLPDASQPLEVDRKPRTGAEWEGTEDIKGYSGTGPTRQEITKAWGFSDGQQLYIRHRGRYYPLRRAGNDFTFEGHAGADAGAMGTAGALGGLAGTAIAAAVTSGQRQEYTLDMATGRVSDYDYLEKWSRRDTARIVVFRRPGGSKAPISLLLDGKPLGPLLPNALLEVPWTSKTREVEVCMQGAAPVCYSFIPDFTATNYVELRAKTETDTPVLETVPMKEGVFYTKKMRRP